uniref:Glycosyltransferase N-terminal domain-containing protein n=1 Tax=Zea mays TaxID=4577 RepID=A0A804MZ53_MAIZE
MAGLHFVLVPLLAQGHIIPMVDLARLLAGRGARVSVVTTPVNAARNGAVVESARRAGLDVELAEVAFPGPGLGLPEGMENVDMVVEKEHFMPFFQATWKMDAPLEEYLRSLPRRPDCVVADSCNPWAARVCARHGIPRLVLHCPSAYFLLATHCLSTHGVYGRVAHELEPFEVPGFPVRAAGNVATFRGFFQWPGMESYERDVAEAEATADGLLINTFRGLEGVFVDGYAAALGRKTTTTCWAVGPTCASSSGGLDAGATAARGNRADVDVGLVLSWLDARPAASVLYVSFGSLAQLSLKQTVELARGLEASGRPFVWAIKEAKSSADVRAWLLAERFEERVRDRGLLVRGWAPQFCSERLLVDVLGVGVRSGVKLPPMSLPDEAEGVQVTSADVEKAVAELMGVGADGTARRARAKELAAKAKAAMEEGGSSYADLDDMLRHVAELNMKKSHEEGTGFSTLPELGTGSKNNDNIGAGAALSVQS